LLTLAAKDFCRPVQKQMTPYSLTATCAGSPGPGRPFSIAAMGIAAAAVSGDGWPAIYVTHLALEQNRLYRNNHDEALDDDGELDAAVVVRGDYIQPLRNH